MSQNVRPSLYERIGGPVAVRAAVEVFYEKVLADDRLSPFFGGLDLEAQHYKMTTFLAMVFGGPLKYTGRDMREAHAPLVRAGLDDEHFDAVLAHLGATLEGMGVDPELIAEVAAVAESTRDDVLDR